MSFLNAILLSGAAAFLVPLIIHLLNRRRVAPVPWAAMHLLQAAVANRRRNLNWEQWLLLLLRLLIPILLALALARPVMTAMRVFGGGKSSVVVVLDDSHSMMQAEAGVSAAQKARNDLGRILKSLPKGSEVQVLRTSDPSKPLLSAPTAAIEIVEQAIENQPSLSGPPRLQDALGAAAAILARSPPGNRELLLVSDFAQSDWGNAARGGSLPALQTLGKLPQPSQVTLYPVRVAQGENLSVVAAELSAEVAAAGQPVGLKVRINNSSSRNWQDVPISLEVDGARLRTSRINLAANSEASLTFTHQFDRLGDHSMGARIEGDEFTLDNARHAVVLVRSPIRVLLVDGNPSKAALQGAADFLRLALSPHRSAGSDLKDLIEITPLENRIRENDLKGCEVVILADVDRMQGSMPSLEAFVRKGGGLLVFAGPKADPTWYGRDFHNKARGLYPANVLGLRRADSDARPARIAKETLTHPALLYFNESRAGRLQDAEFQNWWELASTEGTLPILQLDNGNALMVERPYEKGKVIAVASSANTAWSSLALQPFYVPLMQRLVAHLANQAWDQRGGVVGETLSLRLPDGSAVEQAEFTTPSGKTLTLKPRKLKEQSLLDLPILSEPGIHRLALGAEQKWIACNLDPRESNHGLLDQGALEALAKQNQAQIANSPESWERLDRGRRHGSELWQPALMALLILLFAEVLLQQRIARG